MRSNPMPMLNHWVATMMKSPVKRLSAKPFFSWCTNRANGFAGAGQDDPIAHFGKCAVYRIADYGAMKNMLHPAGLHRVCRPLAYPAGIPHIPPDKTGQEIQHAGAR